MPRYDFSCNACDNIFEISCPIAELDKKHPCPKCKSKKTEQSFITSIGFADSTKMFFEKNTPSGFKEVLKKIKKQNYKSTINTGNITEI